MKPPAQGRHDEHQAEGDPVGDEVDEEGGDRSSMLLNFFLSLLMMRPNKLEHLSLETLSSRVLEFKGKARANPIGAPFKCFLLG